MIEALVLAYILLMIEDPLEIVPCIELIQITRCQIFTLWSWSWNYYGWVPYDFSYHAQVVEMTKVNIYNGHSVYLLLLIS